MGGGFDESFQPEIEESDLHGELRNPNEQELIMGDIKSQMQKQGFRGSSPQNQNHQRGGQGYQDRPVYRLPNDYLSGGYLDDKGNLKERYIARNGDADQIAKELGNVKPAMTNHQLRRFYSHVRAAENKLRMTDNFPSVFIDLKKLEPFVAEAKGKNKIPELFYSFMIRNLEAVKAKKDFTDGFMEHFQAVVAFFTFHHPKN